MRKGRSLATWLAVALLAWLVAQGEATHDRAAAELDVAEAVSRTAGRAAARVLPAVVSIRSIAAERQEYGAGVLVDGGFVLTALHVVDEATSITVQTEDGREHPARVHGEDPVADLCLLELLAPGVALPAATLGDELEMQPGETVLALGNPFGFGGSVSRGVLSARERRNVVPGTGVPLLQTDASINPGSSGGPLVNLRGEVVGLVTAIMTRSGTDEGVGFAVPASELRHALPFLRRGVPVERAWIGARLRARPGVEEGLEVTAVVAHGPAERAGLLVGDVILRAQGRRVGTLAEMRRQLRRLDVGEEVRLGVRRETQLLDLALRAGLRHP